MNEWTCEFLHAAETHFLLSELMLLSMEPHIHFFFLFPASFNIFLYS